MAFAGWKIAVYGWIASQVCERCCDVRKLREPAGPNRLSEKPMSENTSSPSNSFRYVIALLALVLLVAGWGLSMHPMWIAAGVAGLVAAYGLDTVARKRADEDEAGSA